MVINTGLIAIQGNFNSHRQKISEAFPRSNLFLIRDIYDLPEKLDLVIIPGGESSTIHLLAELSGLRKSLEKLWEQGVFFLATCAGAILLSKKIINPGLAGPWNFIEITTQRNAYGRQVDSSIQTINYTESAEKYTSHRHSEGVFIRAPKIIEVGAEVEILARCNKEPVLVKQKNVLGATFHPELSSDSPVYDILKNIICSA